MRIFICDNCQEESVYYAKELCRNCYRKYNHESQKYWEKAKKDKNLMGKMREKAKRHYFNKLKGTEEYKEKRREAQKKWYKKNKYKRRAHKIARKALLAGRIKKDNCDICNGKETEMHHEDYSKPLDIIWLCKNCHMAKHRKHFALTG